MAVIFRGLRELQRDLGKANKGAAKAVREGLKRGAEPVVQAAKAKEGRWAGSKPQTIGPRVTGRSVFVTQRARKVTGLRGDFGRLQQLKAFDPALEENEGEVRRALENELDGLLRRSHL